MRETGFTVAIIGPDGAGKTTVARELEGLVAMPVKYVYMGVNPASSNYLLPTTRAVHALRSRRGTKPNASGERLAPEAPRAAPRGTLRRTLRSGRSFLRLGNRLAEEWYRALVAALHRRRGSIVVFDRHFFADYYAYDVVAKSRPSASRRVHGFVLSRLYPRPDLVIYLDAPAEVLLDRKGEGTLESLDRRRREYLELGPILGEFVVVDATRPLEAVLDEVVNVITSFSAGRSHAEAAGAQTSGRVLVTDAARGAALAVIRSLGRHGFDVVAADSDTLSPGFYSKYTSTRLRYPPPRSDPDGAVEALLRAARDQGVDLIVPATEETVLLLSEARERFAGVTALALPERDAFATTRDKLATLELAREIGVPVPETRLVTSAREALAAAPALGWPVVVKPRWASVVRRGGVIERYEVSYAENADHLREQMRRLEDRSEVLLQEYCRGEGHGVELLLRGGCPLATFQHRRIREVPVTGGASSFRESVPLDPVLNDYALRLLGALRWTGLAMVEFKVGPLGPRLMEINGRIWGSLPLAIKSGIDFPARMADLYLGVPQSRNGPPDAEYALGVRSHNLDLEVIWIGSALRGRRGHRLVPTPNRRDALRVALSLVLPRDGFDVLTRDDPRPGLVEFVRIVRKLSRKVELGR